MEDLRMLVIDYMNLEGKTDRVERIIQLLNEKYLVISKDTNMNITNPASCNITPIHMY